MAKDSKRSASNKRFEALLRAQKINELLKIGGIQSQALLDSAGESRPTDESHVVELLDREKFRRSETASKTKKAGPRSRPRPARKSASKNKRRR